MELDLRATGCHLVIWNHSVTYHPTQVNIICLNPS